MPGNNHDHAIRAINGVVDQSTKLEDDLLNKWAGDSTTTVPTITQQQTTPSSSERDITTPPRPSGGGY